MKIFSIQERAIYKVDTKDKGKKERRRNRKSDKTMTGKNTKVEIELSSKMNEKCKRTFTE